MTSTPLSVCPGAAHLFSDSSSDYTQICQTCTVLDNACTRGSRLQTLKRVCHPATNSPYGGGALFDET